MTTHRVPPPGRAADPARVAARLETEARELRALWAHGDDAAGARAAQIERAAEAALIRSMARAAADADGKLEATISAKLDAAAASKRADAEAAEAKEAEIAAELEKRR